MSATDKKTLKNLRFKVGMVFQYPEYQLLPIRWRRTLLSALKI